MLIKNIQVFLTLLTKDFKEVISSFCKFRWAFIFKMLSLLIIHCQKSETQRGKNPKANLPEFESPVDDVLSNSSSRFMSMQAGKLIKAVKWNNH